jgi:hypothetical protein
MPKMTSSSESPRSLIPRNNSFHFNKYELETIPLTPPTIKPIDNYFSANSVSEKEKNSSLFPSTDYESDSSWCDLGGVKSPIALNLSSNSSRSSPNPSPLKIYIDIPDNLLSSENDLPKKEVTPPHPPSPATKTQVLEELKSPENEEIKADKTPENEEIKADKAPENEEIKADKSPENEENNNSFLFVATAIVVGVPLIGAYRLYEYFARNQKEIPSQGN